MSGQNVGGVRPTQLIYTYGVGSAVDLPQFSAMVMGLDDWPAADMEEIREDRLLRVVRHVLGGQVRKLKAAPLREEAPGPLFRNSSGDGVPVAAFLRWLVCRMRRPVAAHHTGRDQYVVLADAVGALHPVVSGPAGAVGGAGSDVAV